MSMTRRALASVLAVAACGPAIDAAGGLSGGPVGSTSSTTSAPAPTAHADTSVTSSSAGTGAGSSTADIDGEATSTGDTGPLWDLGSDPEPDPAAPTWCSAKKVDFLFVIPRFPGMEELQPRITASLPMILEGIDAVFADFDFHIMVIDADGGGWGDGACIGPVACPGDFGCPAIDEPSYPCWAPKAGVVTYCDGAQGAGVVFPATKGASNKPCPVPPGRRYLEGDDPGLADAFECIARVGYAEGPPSTGQALMDAVGPEHNAPGGCNFGFLRDDALLFITIIQNTGDPLSPYNPLVWANKVKAAKDDDAVFVLGVLSDSVLDPPVCPPNAYDQLEMFVANFEHALEVSACEPTYAPGFLKAATMARMLCDSPAPK